MANHYILSTTKFQISLASILLCLFWKPIVFFIYPQITQIAQILCTFYLRHLRIFLNVLDGKSLHVNHYQKLIPES